MQNILINLDIISKIKPNNKICMSTDNYVCIETDSAFQCITRFFYNNSRIKNLNCLNSFYTSVYNCIDDTINSKYLLSDQIIDQIIDVNIKNINPTAHIYSHKCYLENDNFIKIYNNLVELNYFLKSSITGLDNLKQTYVSDVVTVSKLEIIINDIESNIKKINKKLDYINDIKKKTEE